MRLTEQQKQVILETIQRIAGADTDIYLFGSRLDDAAKGGDIDLLLESETPVSSLQRAQITMQLESLLGLPVDLVSKSRGSKAKPFQVIARASAVKLDVR